MGDRKSNFAFALGGLCKCKVGGHFVSLSRTIYLVLMQESGLIFTRRHAVYLLRFAAEMLTALFNL